MTHNLIYKAIVKTALKMETYIGLTMDQLKDRWQTVKVSSWIQKKGQRLIFHRSFRFEGQWHNLFMRMITQIHLIQVCLL